MVDFKRIAELLDDAGGYAASEGRESFSAECYELAEALTGFMPHVVIEVDSGVAVPQVANTSVLVTVVDLDVMEYHPDLHITPSGQLANVEEVVLGTDDALWKHYDEVRVVSKEEFEEHFGEVSE